MFKVLSAVVLLAGRSMAAQDAEPMKIGTDKLFDMDTYKQGEAMAQMMEQMDPETVKQALAQMMKPGSMQKMLDQLPEMMGEMPAMIDQVTKMMKGPAMEQVVTQISGLTKKDEAEVRKALETGLEQMQTDEFKQQMEDVRPQFEQQMQAGIDAIINMESAERQTLIAKNQAMIQSVIEGKYEGMAPLMKKLQIEALG